MLLVYMANDKTYDLHNGTSFDYLLVMTKKDRQISFKNSMLLYYLEGLLAIIDKIEEEKLPASVLVRGSSYFFSERTANRLGFSITVPKSTERLNLFINFIDLTWMYSLANGKLTFPKISSIKTAEIKGEDLVQYKSDLIQLKAFISRHI